MEMLPRLIKLAQYTAHIGRPIGCTIGFRGRFIHFEIILLNKPSMLGLCNKAVEMYKNILDILKINPPKRVYLK